jgi:hypothetical protein
VADAAFVYRPEVLEALVRHGVRPTSATPPELVHEFVSDLYRFEIRRLRDRLLRNEFPKREYAGRVIELRDRYRVISMRPLDWLAT